MFHAINAGVATHDPLEDPVSFLAGPVVTLFAVAVFALWLLARPYAADLKWKLACASALAAAGLAMLVNRLIADGWDRTRPAAAHPGSVHLLSPPSHDPSFPSDHAAAAFAIAFAVLAFSRRGGYVFLAVATLIGLSRIALGMHYPSDVIAGALVGWLAATAVTRLARVPLTRLVRLISRVSDPLLEPVWQRLPHLARESR